MLTPPEPDSVDLAARTAARAEFVSLLSTHGDDLPLDQAAAWMCAEERGSTCITEMMEHLDTLAQGVFIPTEATPVEAESHPTTTESLSVEDLGAFTIDDVELSDNEDDDEEDGELADFDDMPVLIPDAGKIRFAEDIVEEYRGGARGGRRRGGGTRGGARGGGARGGGARGGGAAAGGGR